MEDFITYEHFIKVHPLAKGLTEEKDLKRAYNYERMIYLQNKLKESDYKAIKYAEGIISKEEYESTKIEREQIREKIRELEKELNLI